jgi:hypothetical protein
MGGIDSPMFGDPITLRAIPEPLGMAHFQASNQAILSIVHSQSQQAIRL